MIRGQHYDASVAGKYDSLRSSWSDQVVNRIVELIEPRTASRILDLGCGTGNLVEGVYRAKECNLVGTDLSLQMLRIAVSKIRYAAFVRADVTALPYRANTFDGAMGAFFIHHVPPDEQRTVIAECYRVMSRGRLAIVTASHAQIEASQVGRFFPEIIGIDKKRFPPIDRMCRWFRDCGFVDVESETVLADPIRLGEDYLSRVEQRHISTFALIGEKAYRRGVKKMCEYVRELNGSVELKDRPVTIVYGTKK